MSRLLTFFLSCTLLTFSNAESFTLDSAVSHALTHQLDLAAARLSIAEARGRLLQAGRLANPELESDLKPNVRGREFALGVGLVQKFSLTQRLRLEKAISQAEVQQAEAEVQAAERKLALAVRTVGVKLLTLKESQALKATQIANSQKLAATATKLAAKAEGSPLEAMQFELEAQQLHLDFLRLEAERATLVGEARGLLGLPLTSAVDFTGSLAAMEMPEGKSPELANLPEYQAAMARAAAARQGLELAKANRWSDAGIGLSTELQRAHDAPDGVQTDGFIGIKFSLPLPFWNKNEGKIREAEATAERAAKVSQALEAQVSNEAASSREAMQAARHLLEEITGLLLPKANELEKQIMTFYNQAQPGTQLAEVLRARERRLTLEQAQLDARQAFHLARIRFQAALGR